MTLIRYNCVLVIFLLLVSCHEVKKDTTANTTYIRPNVILVMTDDQGIGDLGAHGNPWIKTPNIDQFSTEAIQLTDFHVSPLCTPTRSAIMTGLYPINNGTWATFKGRDMLHEHLPTMPEVFKQNGYNTAMFGKWHLGNNYPSRPTDKGFDHAVHHSSGGVGELSDYWGNNYFDDTYLVNNRPRQFKGYCTDVWFNEAIDYIKTKKDEPFFIYLPTNAPHAPLYVADKYADPYKPLVGTKIPNAEFYGMIANIDENFGRLDKVLKELGLAENTILIFCSDNGSQFGVSEDYSLGWNQGFRGRKQDKLEAGHRVPFFIRWPNANIIGGKEISELTNHIDLIPTLAGLCNLQLPEEFKGDGVDFSEILLGEKLKLDERVSFVHHRQDYRQPKPVDGSCIMKGNWRLLNGNELYDIKKDRKQENNIALDYPEVVAELLKANEGFITSALTKTPYQEYAYNKVGTEQNKIKLTIQHAIGDDGPVWQPEQIAEGKKNKNATHPVHIGKKGTYRISCMRWPEENSGPIQGIPKKNPKDLFNYQKITPQKTRISLFNKTYEKEIELDDELVAFELELEEGKTLLDANFIEEDETYGVYYIYIEKI